MTFFSFRAAGSGGDDEFNHLKVRSSHHWSRTLGFGSSDTYTNNRRNGWGYDTDGNWISGAGRQHTYDAAGRMTGITWTYGGSFNQFFDGDGQRVNTTESNVVTYYLRSTVLGGQVIAELDAAGNRQMGFIYAGKKLIAHQTSNGNVSLLHEDPSGVSVRSGVAQSPFAGYWAELDPWGAEVFSWNPYLDDPEFSGGRGEGGPVYPGYGDISMPSTGCTQLLDGVLTLCDFAYRNLNGGGILVERRQRDGTTQRLSVDVVLGIARVWHPGRSGNSSMEIDDSGPGNPIIRTNNSVAGYWETAYFTIFDVPQNPVPTGELERIRGDVETAIAAKKCADFLKALFDEAAVRTGQPYRDIMVTFDNIKFLYGTPGPGHGGEASGSFERGDATALMRGFQENFVSTDRSAFIRTQTAQNFLAETIHHVGTNGAYRDAPLANALNRVLFRQGKDNLRQYFERTEDQRDTASWYLHRRIFTACQMRYK